MAQVKMNQDLFKVVLTEYDRYSGQKVWDTIYFDNEAEARKYAIDYNKKNNNLDYVPEWYIRADYCGSVR